jgi:hypothetical protein
MKKRIPILMLAVALACLFMSLAPSLLRHARLAQAKWSSMAGRRSFYFRQRQWLADFRTIASGVKFLYSSRKGNVTNLMEGDILPRLLPLGSNLTTHLFGMAEDESSPTLVGERLPRAERINGRNQLSSIHGLPPMFASAEVSPLGAGGAAFSGLGSLRPLTGSPPRRSTRWPLRTNLTPPAVLHPAGGVLATNLQGA